MKYFILLYLTTSIAFAQSPNTYERGIAKVDMVNGLEIYFMSEPLRKYEELFTVSLETNHKDKLEEKLSLSRKISTLSEKAREEAAKRSVKIDGIIYNEGFTALAIIFTDNEITKERLAEAYQYLGVELYLFAQPINEVHEFENKKIKLPPSNQSLFEDIWSSNLTDKVKKMKKRKFEAIIYRQGKRFQYVTYSFRGRS